jgi:surface antigen
VVAGLPSRVSVLRSYMRSYRGCPAARLWRRLPAATFTFMLALSLGGCSFSYQLDSMFGKKDDSSLTGTLQQPAAPAIKPVADLPPEGDLVIARAAVSEVMSKGGKDTSVSWENPKTGARGTVTPIAAARSEDGGLTCHEFLASFEREGSSSWMQGEACRANKGKWEVRTLKPWQQRT